MDYNNVEENFENYLSNMQKDKDKTKLLLANLGALLSLKIMYKDDLFPEHKFKENYVKYEEAMKRVKPLLDKKDLVTKIGDFISEKI